MKYFGKNFIGKPNLKVSKNQSAMEYLMTYGWAILIIAVVLIALFQLGVFNGSNLAPKALAGSCEVVKNTEGISLAGQCDNNLPQYVTQFNGGSSYVQPATTGLSPTNLTVSAWIYTVSSSPTQQNIVAYGQSGYASDVYDLATNNLCLHLTSGYPSCLSYPGVTQNRWYNVVATVSYSPTSGNSVESVYVNGVSVVTPATYVGSLYYQYTTNIDFGEGATGGFLFFNGFLANVQIYNTSLSANDVTALYQEGIGGHPLAINNLIGWWPLNGNANDYSGNNNDGTATNVAYTGSWTGGYSQP